MDSIDGRRRELTDNELSAKLSEFAQGKRFGDVLLSYNRLKSVPNCNQFECYGHFHLSHNNIVSVDTEKLPRGLTWLYMQNNEICEVVGDFTEFHNLKCLCLDNNRIQSLNRNKLPAHLAVLLMEQNQLTEIPDMSHCHELSRVNFSDNEITYLDPNKLPLKTGLN